MKESLIKAIDELLSGNICKTYAICGNLSTLTGHGTLGYRAVNVLSRSWEHYSGEAKYPVSGEIVWDNGIHDRNFWWTGEQRKLRMSLLKHMKKELVKMSDEDFKEIFE